MLAKELRTPQERTRFAVAVVVSAIAWTALVVSLVGVLYGLMFGLFMLAGHALFLAYVRGNGVRVGPDQLPDIDARVRRAAAKLGLEQRPEVYVVQAGGMLNAFATKLLSRRFVILFADLVDACEAARTGGETEQPDELDFIIAHEIGHLAAGHLSWMTFLLPARVLPWLGPAYSRACEYTCDRCGHAVVEDQVVSARALTILATGGRIARRVSLDAFMHQRYEAGSFWMAVAELNSSHPFLPKRIAALRAGDRPDAHAPVPRNVFAYPLAPVFAMFAGGSAAAGLYVMVMIGVLAAIAIPNYMKFKERAEAARATTEMGMPAGQDLQGLDPEVRRLIEQAQANE